MICTKKLSINEGTRRPGRSVVWVHSASRHTFTLYHAAGLQTRIIDYHYYYYWNLLPHILQDINVELDNLEKLRKVQRFQETIFKHCSCAFFLPCDHCQVERSKMNEMDIFFSRWWFVLNRHPHRMTEDFFGIVCMELGSL